MRPRLRRRGCLHSARASKSGILGGTLRGPGNVLSDQEPLEPILHGRLVIYLSHHCINKNCRSRYKRINVMSSQFRRIQPRSARLPSTSCSSSKKIILSNNRKERTRRRSLAEVKEMAESTILRINYRVRTMLKPQKHSKL
jgi:hypothetical protein